MKARWAPSQHPSRIPKRPTHHGRVDAGRRRTGRRRNDRRRIRQQGTVEVGMTVQDDEAGSPRACPGPFRCSTCRPQSSGKRPPRSMPCPRIGSDPMWRIPERSIHTWSVEGPDGDGRPVDRTSGRQPSTTSATTMILRVDDGDDDDLYEQINAVARHRRRRVSLRRRPRLTRNPPPTPVQQSFRDAVDLGLRRQHHRRL